jgi:hypothetical protein
MVNYQYATNLAIFFIDFLIACIKKEKTRNSLQIAQVEFNYKTSASPTFRAPEVINSHTNIFLSTASVEAHLTPMECTDTKTHKHHLTRTSNAH